MLVPRPHPLDPGGRRASTDGTTWAVTHATTQTTCAAAGAAQYAYDDNGQRTSRTLNGTQQSLGWSPDGTLETVTGANANETYISDPSGQRLIRHDATHNTTTLRWGGLDMLPQAVQVADPFHVIKLANSKLDECRRRVQNETLGQRGRKDDPLYRSRRLLTKGHERLDDAGSAELIGFLEAGDPVGRSA